MLLLSPKLIVCILPKGRARDVLCALRNDRNILTFSVNKARGVGRLTPLAHRGIGEQTEKEILKVTVEENLADEIFEFIYEQAGINQPHGGLIYMYPLHRATRLVLPDLPEEE